MTSPVLTLRKGALALELAPQAGGSVSRFSLERAGRRIELFRPMPHSAIAARDALSSSCYPLVPLSNRVENGLYSFQGRSFSMEPNMPPHPHPLHGHGWRSVWNVVDRSETSLTLRFDYQGDDWPSRYSATQHIELSDDRLSMTIALENSGSVSMPGGIGFHPFFPCSEQTSLTTELLNVWLVRKDCTPDQRVPVPERWDFRQGRRLDGLDLDHCFGGWSGHGTVRFSDSGIELSIEGDTVFSHAVIYAPLGQPFFCFEPVSHANFALNLVERGVTDIGYRVLEPGETLKGQVRFTVRS
jgi:aldose 1-epimerase